MFTGLVEELGVLRFIRKGTDSAQLNIGVEKILDDIKIGDSIAVNGVCLTVTAFDNDTFTADVMSETLSKTNLGHLKPGDRVNIERALRIGDRLGGHLVSGHIDGVGTITSMVKHDIATIVTIKAPEEVMRYVVRKGSVAIDGISLTIVDCTVEKFSVSLIPHTAHVTNLGIKRVGAIVNLEADLIGKYVERLIGVYANSKNNSETSGVSIKLLMENGFI